MIVARAKNIVREWVGAKEESLYGFDGAFFHGSITWLPDDAVLPATSDVDVIIVLADPTLPYRKDKTRYRDLLIDYSYLPYDELNSPELILGSSHLAGSFRVPNVISDPSGWLRDVQAAVAQDFSDRRWVLQRCEHVMQKILGNLAPPRDAARFAERTTSWLFATGLTTHVLLVAGLRNPTVRRRYLDVRHLLRERGRPEFYEVLLRMLGCDWWDRQRTERHLTALTKAFDTAVSVMRPPSYYASDISNRSRPLAIDGSRELIERGDHREAVFWIVATASRCQQVLERDAPAEVRAALEPAFRQLLADLGINSAADLVQRGEAVRAFLPRLWQVAETIIDTTPWVEDRRSRCPP